MYEQEAYERGTAAIVRYEDAMATYGSAMADVIDGKDHLSECRARIKGYEREASMDSRVTKSKADGGPSNADERKKLSEAILNANPDYETDQRVMWAQEKDVAVASELATTSRRDGYLQLAIIQFATALLNPDIKLIQPAGRPEE